MASTEHPQHAYICHYKKHGHTLSQFEIARDGTFSQLTAPSFFAGSFPSEIIIDKSKRIAHITSIPKHGYISTYEIGSDGPLRRISKDVINIKGEPKWLVMDTPGRFLYVGIRSKLPDTGIENSIGAHVLARPGLRTVDGMPDAILVPGIGRLAITPDGCYAYAVCESKEAILQFSINADGTLRLGTRLDGNSNTRFSGLRVHPNGKNLYAVDLKTVAHYRISDDGSLVEVERRPHPEEFGTSDFLDMHPSGKFLYVKMGVLRVAQYAIRSDGNLELLPQGAVALQALHVNVAFSPSGDYLYGADFMEKRVCRYRVCEHGGLESLPPAVCFDRYVPEFIATI